MTDRELLEAAARAAGWTGWQSKHGYWNVTSPEGETTIGLLEDRDGFFGDALLDVGWNPLDDNSDAFCLAVKLDIVPRVINGVAFAWRDGVCDMQEPCDTDPYAATRRAIVRAAAAMATCKPPKHDAEGR